MARLTSVLALLLASGIVTACGSDDPVGPSEPPPTEITEVFPGTLTVNGGATHGFTEQRAGTVTARVTGLEPSDAVIGLSLGPLSGQACSQSVANDAATSQTALTGTASAGSFCVRVFDSGSLSGPVEYELTVTHF
jgi:hypothetical protein